LTATRERGHLALLLGCLGASLLIRFTLGFGVVSGWSMWPTLCPGDTVAYVRFLEPAVGSVVVADLPGHGLIVKRIGAVGDGGYVLLGDNRDRSYDSRDFGPMPRSRIEGRVVLVWPASRGRSLRPPGAPAGIP